MAKSKFNGKPKKTGGKKKGRGKNYKRSTEQLSNYHKYFGTDSKGNVTPF
jgi:hypothetical protein